MAGSPMKKRIVLAAIAIITAGWYFWDADIADRAYHATPCKSDKRAAPDSCLDEAIPLVNDLEIVRYGWKTRRAKPDNSREFVQTSFHRSWLEYDSAGRPSAKGQKEAILEHIHKSTTSRIFVVIYVHGWHHNADDSGSESDPSWERNNAVKFNNLLALHADEVRRYHSLVLKQPAPAVLGIYIGWQGERTKKPLASLLSIGDRADVADAIGAYGALSKDLSEIADRLRARDEDNKIIVIGHSLGGRMLTQSLLEKWSKSEDGYALGRGSLIVTINAAVGADKYRSVLKTATSSGAYPTWLNITSVDDFSTSFVYPLAAAIGLVDGGRSNPLTWKTVGHYEPFLTHQFDFQHQGEFIKKKTGGKTEFCKIPSTVDDVRGCGLSEDFPLIKSMRTRWFIRDDIGFAYPRYRGKLTCGELGYAQCFDFRDADLYRMKLKTINADLAKGRIWNMSTNKSSIDFEAPRWFEFGTHNGYVSTNPTRLLVELLFDDRSGQAD